MHCCTAAQLHTVVPRAVGDTKYKIRTKMTSVGSQHRLALNFTNGTIWWWMRILCQKKFTHFLLWNLNGMCIMRIDSYPVEIMFKWAVFHWYHTTLPLKKCFHSMALLSALSAEDRGSTGLPRNRRTVNVLIKKLSLEMSVTAMVGKLGEDIRVT